MSQDLRLNYKKISNVIIEDYNNQLFSVLNRSPDINIVAVHVSSPEDKKEINDEFPDIPVYLTSEIISWKKRYAKKEEIIKHYNSQLKVEHFFNRALSCTISERESYYYSSLAFWSELFDENNIDCVLIGRIEHGSPSDTLPINLALERNIPTYVFEIMLYDYDTENMYYGIKEYNTNKYVNISQYSVTYTKSHEIGKYIKRVTDRKKDSKNSNSIESLKLEDLPHNFRNNNIRLTITNIILHLINCQLSIYSTIASILKIQYNKQKEGKKIFAKIGKKIIYLNYYWSFIRGKKVRMLGLVVPESPITYIRGWHTINKHRRYYQKHAVKNISNDEKYILYALHFEPEASIMARTIYNSQLYNILALSHALPEGWKLYVKEHPSQFNPAMGPHFLKNINIYRNKSYYNFIRSLPNTHLLDSNLSSQSLINGNDNSIPKPKAISTINGSITLEAIVNNIPVVLFDKSTVSYESPLIIDVEDMNNLPKIMQNIATGNYHENDMELLINSIEDKLFICTPKHEFLLPDDFILNLVHKNIK